MKISQYNSQKIRVLNLVLIMMVLYIHSYYHEAAVYPFALAVQRIFGGWGLSCVANSLFFLMSGMLFFKGVERVKDCFPKMAKRVRSLIVPYVLWNCIFVLWYVVLQNIPGIGGFINSDMVGSVFGGTLGKALTTLLWEPANFPLWFLRDLIVMVALSPVLYYIIKYLKWFAPLIFVAISPFVNLHISPFFLIGGCVAMHASIEKLDMWLTKWITAVCAFVYVASALCCIWVESYHNYVAFIACLCGVVTVWRFYDFVASNERITKCLSPLSSALGYSFFIYLFHEPVFNIIKKIPIRLFGDSEPVLVILFLINPIIMAAVAVVTAKVVQKCLPKLYSILVGGR